MRVQVKICGLTRPADARLAASLGATHLGAVLAPDSPRAVSPEQAARVFAAGDGRVQPVLVFRRAAPETVRRAARLAGTTHVQLHGFAEGDALRLEAEGLTVYRVHSTGLLATGLPPLRPEPSERRPAILDTGEGGSGRSWDWRLLAPRAPDGVFIAGGLRPENLGELLPLQPYGIDLSSGVECAPGLKDRARLELLFQILEERS